MNPKYEDAGYPQFSDIHEYPNINTPIERKKYDQYYQKKNKIPKHKKKNKKYSKQKAPKKPNTNPNQLVQNQLYMSRGGHQYMAVPVGQPKYVPMATPKPKYQYVQPQYQYVQSQYQYAQPQYQYVQPQYQTPYYQTQPMFAQPYAYPYYGQPVRKPKTYVVLPPGYQRDYSARYCPYGDIEDDLDNIF